MLVAVRMRSYPVPCYRNSGTIAGVSTGWKLEAPQFQVAYRSFDRKNSSDSYAETVFSHVGILVELNNRSGDS